jgi:fermentation-respiration switch protein FrsA (DUF1100 family)
MLKKLRNYFLFLSTLTLLFLLGVYIFLIPAFHIDKVTEVALKPETVPADKPVVDTTAGIAITPLSFEVARKGKKLKLSGGLYKAPKNKGLVLYSHGNAAAIDARFSNYRIGRLLKHGYSVFLYDYEGYGRSQGTVDYRYLLDDALAAYNYVLSLGYKPEEIIGFGESLGGGVTTELARLKPLKAIILDNTFTSPERWAKARLQLVHIYPTFTFPAPHYDNLDYLRGQHPPCFIISGALDDTIPFSHSDQMKEEGGANTTLVRLPHSPHCYISREDYPLFEKALDKFIREIEELK